MKIQKIINNNVISALDEQGQEIVAMGKGIGYQRRSGQEISEVGVEKIFRLESPDILEHFKKLIADMPLACIEVSDEIITYAKSVLTVQLSQSVYLTLTDHINFALVRFKEGMLFENALYNEIKNFYPEEFKIGRHALDLIEEKTGVRLPYDEAASIAFHLVNAEFGIRLKDVHLMTEMMRHLVGMVNTEVQLPPESVQLDRLVTNLKFVLNRLLLKKPAADDQDLAFNEFIRKHCGKEYVLAQKMRNYIESVIGCNMAEAEVIYLTIQLKYIGNADPFRGAEGGIEHGTF